MTTTATSSREFGIYLASLSDYVCGYLHGKWVKIDSDTTVDSIYSELAELFATSPAVKNGYTSIAEEWAIHDYDGFPNCDEWTSFERLIKYATLYEEHGEALIAYGKAFNDADLTKFSDYYAGESSEPEYCAEKDFVTQLCDDTGFFDGWPETAISYFDFDMYARDLFITDFTSERVNGVTYVFYNR